MFLSTVRILPFSSLFVFPLLFVWGGQKMGIHVSDFIIIFPMSEVCWFSKTRILKWASILNFNFYAVSPSPVFPLITAYKTLPQFVLSLTLPLLKSFSSLNYILSWLFQFLLQQSSHSTMLLIQYVDCVATGNLSQRKFLCIYIPIQLANLSNLINVNQIQINI